jgi:hypothetical protein
MTVQPFFKFYNIEFHKIPFKCSLSCINAYRRIDRRTDITNLTGDPHGSEYA